MITRVCSSWTPSGATLGGCMPPPPSTLWAPLHIAVMAGYALLVVAIAAFLVLVIRPGRAYRARRRQRGY